MAFDSICVKKTVCELENSILDGRIDKIHQPEKDELLIVVRTYKNTYRLVLSASANNSRVHFTERSKENPKTPPMFCMLLRKHLSGGKVIKVSQPDFERIIELDIESRNELGDLTIKHLITEIMGRNSNIILCDENYRIIDAARRVDFTVSSVRQILPGIVYQAPPRQEKHSVFADNISDVTLDFSAEGQRADKVIMSAVSGISPITAREIIFDVCGTTSLVCGELSQLQRDRITEAVRDFTKNISYAPCIVFDTTGKPLDFSATKIAQYGSSFLVKYYDTMSEVVNKFYEERDLCERMRQKSADLLKLLHTNIERTSKKLVLQQKTLKDAENKEKYKIYGDLLTANLYRIEQGQATVEVENYYEENCPTVTIELSPMLSPSKNAQRYYKLYGKLKNAEVEVQKQLEASQNDLEYLESTLSLTENATSEGELNDIRSELAQTGYIKRQKKAQKSAKTATMPMHFVSDDGFDIYVGRNNTQNDYLSLRFANSQDMWFHTKNIHGSHTIIKLGIDKEIPEATMRYAAELAAYYSKARNSSQVPVDYTQIKNVRKPNGAKPGMVIYEHYNTVYVTPKKPLE